MDPLAGERVVKTEFPERLGENSLLPHALLVDNADKLLAGESFRINSWSYDTLWQKLVSHVLNFSRCELRLFVEFHPDLHFSFFAHLGFFLVLGRRCSILLALGATFRIVVVAWAGSLTIGNVGDTLFLESWRILCLLRFILCNSLFWEENLGKRMIENSFNKAFLALLADLQS